jgi:predicted ABC-type ATPase
MELVSEMIPFCHRCFILDNSLEINRLIVEIEDGKTIKILSDEIPAWVETYILEKLGV